MVIASEANADAPGVFRVSGMRRRATVRLRIARQAAAAIPRWVVAIALVLASGAGASAQTMAGGENFSIVLKSDGTVWTFGANNHGQLGNNSTMLERTPIQVPGLSSIVAVAAGRFHALALKSDGTLLSVRIHL